MGRSKSSLANQSSQVGGAPGSARDPQNKVKRINKGTQLVKAFATQPNDPSVIPTTLHKVGEDSSGKMPAL